MLLMFDLSRFSKVRVWDECSENNLMNNELSQPEISVRKFSDKSLVLEYINPTGGRTVYGLLGVTYKPFSEKGLTIKISVKNQNNKVFSHSLLPKISEATYIGLITEYREYVEKGFAQACKKNKIELEGELDFCYAAHGVFSSCGLVFCMLSYCLVNLISLKKELINEEIVSNILKESRTISCK